MVSELIPIAVALDWLPNTIHSGVFVALENGYYVDAGLDVKVISPHIDNYTTTPGQRVVSGEATVAYLPKESIVSYGLNTEGSKQLVAVAQALAKNDSAIVTLKSSGIDQPKLLDGKKYASYAARYEGRIVQKMIQNDGGKGDFIETVPPMLAIWDALLKGEYDATWVFLGWEGVAAQMEGVQLNTFKPDDFGVPYGPAPVLACSRETFETKGTDLRKFLEATQKGYEYARQFPEEAAKKLVDAVKRLFPEVQDKVPLELVTKSQVHQSANYAGASGEWGPLNLDSCKNFVDWLAAEGLLTRLKQSRTPDGTTTASLDDLRQGKGGDAVSREEYVDEVLFNNSLWA